MTLYRSKTATAPTNMFVPAPPEVFTTTRSGEITTTWLGEFATARPEAFTPTWPGEFTSARPEVIATARPGERATALPGVFATVPAVQVERCRFEGQCLAVLADTEALQAVRLAGGRAGRLIAVRCEPCRGWHIRPRTERTR